MAYRYTLENARADIGLRNVCGCNVNSPQFVYKLNRAQSRLANRGDFYGMIQTCCMVFQGCQIAWPRYFGTIIGARSHRGEMVSVKNDWYSFTGAWMGNSGQGFSDLGRYGAWGNGYGYQSNLTMVDNGQAPIFQDITGGGNGQLIRYYVKYGNDLGKKITLYGNKFGNSPLQELDANGNWENGLTLTAATPYATTTDLVTKIQSITREPTQGPAYLYEYDTASDTQRLLAVFEPNDTNPVFRRSVVNGVQKRNSTTPQFNCIEVLVKLEFIPVVADRDFLLVDNWDALKFMFQAIAAEDANDNVTAESFIVKAVQELNFQDRNKWPNKSVQVVVNATNSNRTLVSPI